LILPRGKLPPFRSKLNLNLFGPDVREEGPYFRADFVLAAAFAFLGTVLGFNAAALFAVPAFFVIGTSQQTNSQSLHPQGYSTATAIPHSSQKYRSPSLDFGISSSFNVLFVTFGGKKRRGRSWRSCV
jgi:hypothetical protein